MTAYFLLKFLHVIGATVLLRPSIDTPIYAPIPAFICHMRSILTRHQRSRRTLRLPRQL